MNLEHRVFFSRAVLTAEQHVQPRAATAISPAAALRRARNSASASIEHRTPAGQTFSFLPMMPWTDRYSWPRPASFETGEF
jgi:hypothetical protein